MTYSILAINPGHNGSAALVVDGQVVFYGEEERFSRLKYDGNPFKAMMHVLVNNKIDEFIIGGTTNELSTLPWTGEDAYTAMVRKFNPEVKVTRMGHLHHLGHAAAAFYGSGFETAIALVVDGAGSYRQELLAENGPVTGGFETESIYHCSYPHEFNAIYKRYSDGRSPYLDNGVQEFDDSVTITKAYEAVSDYLGFGFIEAGKTMGLAPYGADDAGIPDFFVNDKGNKNLLIPMYPAGAYIDENRNPYLKRFTDPKDWHNDFSMIRDVDKNLAYKVQQQAEEQMYRLIDKALDITGETNIVISGGFGLNCVANYKYVKKYPNVKFYIDPCAHDGGTAIGLARHAWYQYSKSMDANKLTTLYLSAPPDYSQLDVITQQIPNVEVVDTTPADVADLLDGGSIVAMFNGRAEGGPRALGNRSILFDPRRKDGKEFVNIVKRREWFRPFAGSVLEEDANEWFDMAGMESSPYMMYAVDVREDKVDKIPAVTHVNLTCRVQTVNKEQNEHYYNLISAFKDKTGVPLVFNTSFNLAGQPLVETLFDAILTIFNSDINYLYLPEIGKIVKKI